MPDSTNRDDQISIHRGVRSQGPSQAKARGFQRPGASKADEPDPAWRLATLLETLRQRRGQRGFADARRPHEGDEPA